MAKIICDVCGTSYPETASHCPICGCTSSVGSGLTFDPQPGGEEQRGNGYTYVKGGRFSKSNVKKKKHTEQTPSTDVKPVPDDGETKSSGGHKWALLVALFAILAAIAVVIFVTVRFFILDTPDTGAATDTTTLPTASTAETTEPTETTEATQETTEATLPPVPCTEVVISKTSIRLDKVGASVLLNVTVTPVDTTDEIVFASDNEKVATVSSTGKVTAVAGGEAIITVTCGDAVATCKVTCTMEGGETDPTEPSQEPTEPENSDFALTDTRGNVYSDITLTFKGENYKLYNGDVALDQIKWSSDNEKVATFEAGIVKAVGKGTTTIHAEYNGVKRSCIVRCETLSPADSGISGSDNVTEDSTDTPDVDTTNAGAQTGTCQISATDVTISVGETFTLTLVKENGDPVFANWSVGNGSICSVSNNNVTGSASGMTTVSYTYEGVTYSCIVRVR